MLTIPSHPFRQRFKDLRISQFQLARFLKISQPSLSQRLMGYRPFTPEQEQKLLQLIETIEREGKAHERKENL